VIISGGPDDPTEQHNDFQSERLPDSQLQAVNVTDDRRIEGTQLDKYTANIARQKGQSKKRWFPDSIR
jgi:hypothetical protein